ncbi:MAG: hypothetical protein JWM77_3130 [Rhodospirillales bacterium]|nr:hypothetical protein [Rhodospirillales bacterium]
MDRCVTRPGTRPRRNGALLVLSTLLLLCFGLPCPRGDATAHASTMQDCPEMPGKSQVPPDTPAQCLLGYSIPAIGPTGGVTRIAYLDRPALLLADRAHESAIVEPPLPPPRTA